MAQQDTTAAGEKYKPYISQRSSNGSKSFENNHIIFRCSLSLIRSPGTSRPLDQNRDSGVELYLFSKLQRAGDDSTRVDRCQRLESLAQKLRVFAAVVSEPAIPERIGAHTVVRDAI